MPCATLLMVSNAIHPEATNVGRADAARDCRHGITTHDNPRSAQSVGARSVPLCQTQDTGTLNPLIRRALSLFLLLRDIDNILTKIRNQGRLALGSSPSTTPDGTNDAFPI